MSWREHLEALRVRPIGQRFLPLSRDQINELVRRTGGNPLPSSYVEFLESYGEAAFTSENVIVTTRSGATVPLISTWGGKGPRPCDEDIFWAHEMTADEYGIHRVPIADDPFGRPFLLDTRTGQISWGDERLPQGEVDVIADSFDDFIALLHDDPDRSPGAR